MLDLFISFINYLIVWIRPLINKYIFHPPLPQGYITEKISPNSHLEKIKFLRNMNKEPKYEEIQFKVIKYDYVKIPDKENNSFIPLLVIRPINSVKICIIYSHGNSGDLGTSFFESLELSLYTKSCVLLYDYPSFGECRNKPLTEENVYYNIRKTYEFAKNTLKYKSEQIILYGFSLGTGISFDLACNKKYIIAGCILQAPFLSILRTMYDLKKTYFFDSFNNCDKAKNLNCPLMIIHGNKDLIVPYIHGRILAKLVPQKYLIDFLTVKDAGHNNVFREINKDNISKEQIYKRIRKFIELCTGINYEENEIENQNNVNNNSSENKNKLDEKKQKEYFFLNDIITDHNYKRKDISANTVSYRNKTNVEIRNKSINEGKRNLSDIIKSHGTISFSNDQKTMEDNQDILKNSSFNQINDNKENINESAISIEIDEQKKKSK